MNIILKRIFLTFLILAGMNTFFYAQTQEPVSLTLEKALEIALSENPTIKIADREIQKQKYSKKENLGYLLPKIDGTASYNRNLKTPVMFLPGAFVGDTTGNVIPVKAGVSNSYNLGVSATVPLFNMGLYRTIQLSEINILMSLEKARQSKLDLKNQVEKTYYAYLLAKDAYDVMSKSMENAQVSYKDAKNKYEQGLVAEYDLIRAEVRVSNIRPNLIDAQNSISTIELQLKMLLGLSLEMPILFEGKISDYENDYNRYAAMLNYSIDQNSDLKQIDIQEKLLNKQIELQNTEYMPNLSFAINYNYITQSNDFKFSEYKWFGTPTLGISLQVPIFSGFTRKNKINQLKMSLQEAQLQRDYLQSSLNVKAKSDLSDMRKAIEQLESNKDGIRSAEKAFTIAQSRYNSGMGTLLELNDSEVALTQARLNYSQSIYNYMIAKSDYELLIGNDY
ncbi:MAG: TolC family protein [Candidatus Azobacteroides sp.]|nr:TolC family protein [Candidatus Azobacteroides sp.]